MPIPIAALAAAAPIVSGAIGSASTSATNAKQARYNTAMYEKQKRDNLQFWNMQNEYNSPQNQMRLLQEAGLNPHLIHPNSGQSGSISTPDTQGVQFRSPDWGQGLDKAPLAYMNAIYDLEIKQAQTDLLKAQKTTVEEDALLKRTNRERGQFDLAFETDLRDVSADARRERVRQMQVGSDLALKEDVRRELTNASSLREAAQRILNLQSERGRIDADTRRIQQNIRLMVQDGTLKDLEIELRKIGLNPNSPYWATMLGRVFSSDAPGKFLDYLKGTASPGTSDGLKSLIFGSGFKAPLERKR